MENQKITVNLNIGLNVIKHSLKKEVYSLFAFYENKSIQLDWSTFNEIDKEDSENFIYIYANEARLNVTLKLIA